MNTMATPMEMEIKKNIEEEKTKLAEFYEAETKRLKEEHDSQRKEKEELMNGKFLINATFFLLQFSNFLFLN